MAEREYLVTIEERVLYRYRMTARSEAEASVKAGAIHSLRPRGDDPDMDSSIWRVTTGRIDPDANGLAKAQGQKTTDLFGGGDV